MKMNSHSTRFRSEIFPYPTDFSDNEVYGGFEIDDENIGYSVNTGVLWKPHPKISIGAVYKSGPKFTVTGTLILTETSISISGVGYEAFEPDLTEFTLKVPDSFGAGVAFRATDFLTLTLDVVHIQYEELLEDFDIGLDPHAYSKGNFTVNNVTEVHFGVEYILTLGERYLALRAGIYTDPDHAIRFTGTTEDPVKDIAGRETFPGGEDQIHVTGGLGVAFSKQFQIDAAANIADRNKQLSISAVYRF
jgi:long-subunit fatty acid transport protein